MSRASFLTRVFFFYARLSFDARFTASPAAGDDDTCHLCDARRTQRSRSTASVSALEPRSVFDAGSWSAVESARDASELTGV